jgi:hypothetical protein
MKGIAIRRVVVSRQTRDRRFPYIRAFFTVLQKQAGEAIVGVTAVIEPMRIEYGQRRVGSAVILGACTRENLVTAGILPRVVSGRIVPVRTLDKRSHGGEPNGQSKRRGSLEYASCCPHDVGPTLEG